MPEGRQIGRRVDCDPVQVHDLGSQPHWPHEYTVKAWRPDLAETFEVFCQLILDHGVVEPWPPPPAKPILHNYYLLIGGHEYWAMGPSGDSDPIEDKTVINRAAWAAGDGDEGPRAPATGRSRRFTPGAARTVRLHPTREDAGDADRWRVARPSPRGPGTRP